MPERTFSLRHVMSVITGKRLLRPDETSRQLWELIESMTGEVYPQVGLRVIMQCQLALIEQHPQLRGIEVPIESLDSEATMRWLDQQEELYGETLVVKSIVDRETTTLNIGVVGYGHVPFDRDEALRLLGEGLDAVLVDNPTATSINLISALTDQGIPALAYSIAKERGWKTIAVACTEARGRSCSPVDMHLIVGDTWSDTNTNFFALCDAIVRIGGGKRCAAEVVEFARKGGKLYQHELPRLTTSSN